MRNSFHTLLFVVAVAAFLCGLTLSVTSAFHIQSVCTQLPVFHGEPLEVRPLYDDARIVSDGQLRDVLLRLRPPSLAEFPKVNHIDHALRFWGADIEFPGTEHPDGAAMRAFLLNDVVFRKTAEAQDRRVRSLVENRDHGIRFRTQEGRDTSSHTDHTLSTLAEAGTPLSFPVKTPSGDRPLRLALQYALRTFEIDQPEYEWTAMAFALYQVDDTAWYSEEGFQITWDRVAERLMRQRMGQGSCYGGHRLYTLTAILRIHDEYHPMLSEGVRRAVAEHLFDATRRLVMYQSSEGWMDGAWTGETIIADDKLSAMSSRLLSTGHALEWWAIAPEDLQPPRETVVRAGQWLTKTILELNDGQIRSNYTFLTHVGRALALWRGVFPAEFEL